MSIDHTRHSGIFDVSHLVTCLIGAGGIGSLTAIALGKMGVGYIDVFDDDVVDDINIATQFYRVEDIGHPKAHVTERNLKKFGGYKGMATSGYQMRFDKDVDFPGADIYISAVDSIKSRKGIWEAISKNLLLPGANLNNVWYIDARMGAEVFEMFTVNLSKPMWYEDHIRKADDGDYPDLPCTSKATIYTAAIATGHIGAAVRRIATLDQSPGFLSHDIVGNKLYFQEMN